MDNAEQIVSVKVLWKKHGKDSDCNSVGWVYLYQLGVGTVKGTNNINVSVSVNKCLASFQGLHVCRH